MSNPQYIVEDWTGKRLFADLTFPSFEEGWGYIYANVPQENEDDHTYDDYYVVELSRS